MDNNFKVNEQSTAAESPTVWQASAAAAAYAPGASATPGSLRRGRPDNTIPTPDSLNFDDADSANHGSTIGSWAKSAWHAVAAHVEKEEDDIMHGRASRSEIGQAVLEAGAAVVVGGAAAVAAGLAAGEVVAAGGIAAGVGLALKGSDVAGHTPLIRNKVIDRDAIY